MHRKGCYICEDREFARMGLPLCKRCCVCAAEGKDGHIPADDETCSDCDHQICTVCVELPPQTVEICTCDTPCCEVDVGVGIINCGGYHCPTHGVKMLSDIEKVSIRQAAYDRAEAIENKGTYTNLGRILKNAKTIENFFVNGTVPTEASEEPTE